MKQSKPFIFTYQHKRKVVRDLKFVDQITDLTIKGVGYYYPNASIEERYEFDLDSIEGMSPLEILQSEVDLDDISEAVMLEVQEMFELDKPSDFFKALSYAAYAPYVPKEELDKIIYGKNNPAA